MTVVDPQRLRPPTLPPPVHLVRLTADGVELRAPDSGRRVLASSVPPAWSERFRSLAGCDANRTGQEPGVEPLLIPPGVNRLEFQCSGLSLVAPEQTQYRFLLEGFDTAWQEAGTRRSIDYNRVPPGRYRFHVQAGSTDGVCDAAPAVLSFIVLPRWWETGWLQSGILIGLGAVLFGAYHLRVRHLHRAAQRQAMAFSREVIGSQESERKRIASELHDGLGQTLLIIKNRAVMALRESNSASGVQQQVEHISRTASIALQEVRRISHALRPAHLERLGLTVVIQALADEVAEAGTLKVELNLDNLDQLFSPDQAILVYRVFQEALANILKHARAETLLISARVEPGRVVLRMEDDGVGFDPEAVKQRKQAGLGLVGMDERIHQLGGTMNVESGPGRGTCLTMTLPTNRGTPS